ncbi:acetyltransferase [Fulvivirga sp. M361]|uniref:GNAT family N-acetyltransferase n=1 Tax=Fulvivirga sp. M361 TaxID=2594266 RepID=UPI00117A3F2C|nr:GNAT family N-acetyltransferase [Fulvivirga sp. M361]TRX52025.1 acetyltransferase [Fulvivirga sp. M361]
MKSVHDIITLRQATIQDLDLLSYWDEQPHVIASDPDDDWDWDVELRRYPSWREQLVAELERRPIGFIQIIDPALEDTHYWGKVPPNLRAIDIWIGLEQDLGKGYGTQMMCLALDRCFATLEVTSVWIDPLATNIKAIRFYERIGFKFVEPRRFGMQDCMIYRFDREDWEQNK